MGQGLIAHERLVILNRTVVGRSNQGVKVIPAHTLVRMYPGQSQYVPPPGHRFWIKWYAPLDGRPSQVAVHARARESDFYYPHEKRN